MSTIPILSAFPSAGSLEQRSGGSSIGSTVSATVSDFMTVTITALSSESSSSSSFPALGSATPTPNLTAIGASNSTITPYTYKDNKFSRADWALAIILGGGGIILCCMVPIVIAVYWKDWQKKRREVGGDSGEDF